MAQSLHLLNSTDIQSKLTAGLGRAALLSKDEEQTLEEEITELHYWAYARPPTDEKMKYILTYFDNEPNPQRAFEDLLWAMFNTKEFLFNH